jgi:hypothetical protein
MSNKSFALLRTTSFNSATIEKDRLFGFFKDRDAAELKAQQLDDAVFKNIALRGFSFIFYVKEVMSDSTDE